LKKIRVLFIICSSDHFLRQEKEECFLHLYNSSTENHTKGEIQAIKFFVTIHNFLLIPYFLISVPRKIKISVRDKNLLGGIVQKVWAILKNLKWGQ
jgi:hypothetical protein